MLRNLKHSFYRRNVFFVGILLMLLMAFFQGYKTTHDLNWAFDTDFDRDISFIQGNLDGQYGRDPNYLGEYVWYNPLLFSIETVIVKATGLPANIVVTRAGVYLNLLAPIVFVWMALMLFGFEIAIAALLSFLFLAAGNILGWGSATYSPWLYPVCFVQFLFYFNVILLYKALSTQRFFWFLLLGTFTGISFLGHVAPALIMVSMIAGLQVRNLYHSLRIKNTKLFQKYCIQSAMLAVTFLIAASPLLVVIAGHYKMRYVNRDPFEYTDQIFQVRFFRAMVKENLNLVGLVSIAGFYRFYKVFHNWVIRSIITGWLLVCLVLYIYSSMVPIFHHRFQIDLPVTVPSFHYFFYLKALQSLFFGFGLLWILTAVVNWITTRMAHRFPGIRNNGPKNLIFVLLVLLIAILYFPFYQTRRDFVFLREMAIQKDMDLEKLEVYHYIRDHITPEKVILCEPDPSIYPVMATGRKMVSINATFSNPFVSFEQRENDRNSMLTYLITGLPVHDGQLFRKYQVSYILLTTPQAEKIKQGKGLPGALIFRNKSFILLSIAGYYSSIL